jgi:hypothetical protein
MTSKLRQLSQATKHNDLDGPLFDCTFMYPRLIDGVMHTVRRRAINCVMKVTLDGNLVMIGFETLCDGEPSLQIKSYRWDRVESILFLRSAK